MAYDDEARPDTSVALSRARAATDGGRARSGHAAYSTADDAAIVAEAPAGATGGSNPVAAAALQGLLAPRKTLPPSLFYDEEGCRLFYEITKLPEYYLTRAEFRLLAATAPEVAAALPTGATLVEYGASDETKAEMLLRQTGPADAAVFTTYVPIDVAGPALRAMRARLAVRRPSLAVVPVTADFLRPIHLPERHGETAVMGFFPGSTIGNLEPEAAVAFLHRARTALGARTTPEDRTTMSARTALDPQTTQGPRTSPGQGARFLLGFDTCRDAARLIPAYDDPAGVTARFNRNLLTRLNREADATFDPAAFAHRAVWNEAESRIEMHLASRVAQTVLVAGQPVHFARDETIHTENSYKYAPARMRAMIRSAGWSLAKTWSDSNELFAIWLLD